MNKTSNKKFLIFKSEKKVNPSKMLFQSRVKKFSPSSHNLLYLHHPRGSNNRLNESVFVD
jgi:hypothetical protein